MAADNKTRILKSVRQRRYLNKDFNAFKQDMLAYARQHFPDKIQDFSEAALGGLFMELCAGIGDNLSFYLDHQFSELFSDTAIEDDNLEHQIRDAGVLIVGASPAVVAESFLIEVPAAQVGSNFVPNPAAIPTIQEGSVVTSRNGTEFTLTEDVDFSLVKANGDYKANVIANQVRSDGAPLSFIMKADGIAISGKLTTETFGIPSTFVPFREISLRNADVTELILVNDTVGNIYYEVDSLTEDTVFRRVANLNEDNEIVKEVLEIIPAPYRFTKSTNPSTRITTLRFGGGSADTLDDDIIPDPSEFALPLFGKKTFTTFSLNPNRLLSTRTLGVAATNVTLSVSYRYGGGLQHNAEASSISISGRKVTIDDNYLYVTTSTGVIKKVPLQDISASAKLVSTAEQSKPIAGRYAAYTTSGQLLYLVKIQ